MNELSLAVLISGNGSNLQSIIDAVESSQINAKIKVVISNNGDAKGLLRAQKHGIDFRIIDHREFNQRSEFDQVLQDCLEEFKPDFIILAGFMRVLGSALIQAHKHRILNIHPSLLPKYKGLNTHQQVLENKDSEHGVSIHVVTEALDEGPVVMQGRFAVKRGDTISDLKLKGHKLEHKMYPLVLKWLGDGSLIILRDGGIMYQQQKLNSAIEFENA